MAALDERIAGYNNYVKTQREIETAKKSVAYASAYDMEIDEKTFNKARQSNPYEQYKAWGVFKDDSETMTKITELVTQMSSLQTQNYNLTAQGYRNINRIEGITVGGGRSRVGTSAPDVVIEPLAGIKFQQTEFDGGVMSREFNSMVTELAAKYFKETFDESIRNMDSETVKSLMQTTETVNDVFKNVDMNKPAPKKQDNGETKEKTKETDEIGKAAKAFGAMNNIMGALQNMGVKVPEGLQKAMNVMQSLISAIQSVQTIVQMFSTSSQAANTAAVTANTGALIAMQGALAANTTINAIPFLAGGGVAGKVVNSKRFAHGGMVVSSKRFAFGGIVSGISKRAANGFVGGNNYSGDLIPIAVNSGELILNRAQQGNIASQLTQGSGIANLSLEKVITGEDIRIVLNNNKRRRSRGEYL